MSVIKTKKILKHKGSIRTDSLKKGVKSVINHNHPSNIEGAK